MHPLIIAALLLLQTYAPDAYQSVSRYQIRTIETSPYDGTALCGEGIIVISIPRNTSPEQAAGTLAHEAKHLNDDCPMYDNLVFEKRLYREVAAYRYQLSMLGLIPGTDVLQEWATTWYWKSWWREHGKVRSLGILPTKYMQVKK